MRRERDRKPKALETEGFVEKIKHFQLQQLHIGYVSEEYVNI